MKVEIKITEMMNIIRTANSSEILLWILSIIFYNPMNRIFILLHFLHFVRGIIGFFILIKLPQTHNIIKAMEDGINKDDLENKIFNDYTRNILNVEVFEKAKPLKNLTLVYVILTLLNIFIDFVDFLNNLSKLNSKDFNNIDKIYMVVNFLIAVLYIGNYLNQFIQDVKS